MSRMTRSQFLRVAAMTMGPGMLLACGGPAAGTSSQASTTQEPAAPAKRPVTVIVDNDWTEGDRMKVVQAWLDRAKKVYPHIKTELRDNAASQDKTIALFATGEQGDLYQLDQHVVPVFGPKGLLQDISSTLASLKFDVNSVYDIPSITQWNGKRHGLLIQFQTFMPVYNVDAFQKSGVKPPAPGWTWDDWLDMAKKTTQPAESTPRWGTSLSGDPYHLFWSAGAQYLNANGTATQWDSPACRAVVQWMVDLVQRHRVTPPPLEASQNKLSFANGNYAIDPHQQPSPGITKAVDGRFQWDVVPPAKHPTTGKGVTDLSGHNYLVTTKASQRGVLTEATQVLIELFNPEIQDLYNSGLNLGSLPVLKSVAAKTASVPGMPKNFQFSLDAIAGGQNFEKIVGFLDFHRAWTPELQKALNGTVTVDQAVANMTIASNAALAQAAR